MLGRYWKMKQAEKNYELATRAANRDFCFRVVDACWATIDCLADESYKTLTMELLEIDKLSSALYGDVPPCLHWSRRYEYPYAILNSVLPEHPSKDFKILNCGPGISPLQFYLAIQEYIVYSLDVNLITLERVARFKLEEKLKTLYPVYGNLLDLPFPDDYFDRVLSISVLEHIIEAGLLKQNTNVILKGFVNELLRVLKPEGLVVFTFDVNMKAETPFRLRYDEYESLCEILGIRAKPPPHDRLYSSDTGRGRMMGENLCVYCVTLRR